MNSSITIRYRDAVRFHLCCVNLWCAPAISDAVPMDEPIKVYDGEREVVDDGWVKMVSKDKGVHWICPLCYKECIGD